MQGDGTQWSFAPNTPPPHSPVHIVLTGAGPPAVWVFDPSCARDGLEYSQIRNPEDIDPLIESIRGRIQLPAAHAPAPLGGESSDPPPRAFSKEASA